MKSSLTGKLFFLTASLLTVCCVATYGLIAWLVPKTYPGQIDLERAELFAYEAAQELRQTNIEDYPFRAEALQEIFHEQFEVDVALHIFNDSGNEISRYDALEQTGFHVSDYESGKRTQAYSFTFLDGMDKYSLFYADTSQAVNQAMEALSKAFPYLIVLVLFISFLTGFFYSKYITAPIKKLNRASQKLAALDFEVKTQIGRTDELGGVSTNLSALAEKLSVTLNELESANIKLADDYAREKQTEKQRTELFSSISHELKTPITIVKGQLQGMIGGIGRYKDRDTYLVQSLGAVTHLESMVQELLEVSRMEAPDYVCTHEPFDLVALIRQCLNAQEDLFIGKDITLECHLPGSQVYTGDTQLLKRTFDNLIANALAYSPEGSRVKVNLSSDDHAICFTIENTGVHIEEKDLPRVFDAFYRTEKSRNRQTGGSGLGLYIVKKALDLHHAKYIIGNTTEGVVFTITF